MNMMSIYRKVAKKHGISIGEVKRETEAAIKGAYKNPYKSEGEAALQNSVIHRGEIPATEEMIRFVVSKIK